VGSNPTLSARIKYKRPLHAGVLLSASIISCVHLAFSTSDVSEAPA